MTCLLFLSLLAACNADVRRLGSTPSFTSSSKSLDPPLDLTGKSRVFVPYCKGTGMAYGMGAAEQIAYDNIEKYIYAISEQGAVNVVDFSDPLNATVQTSFFIDLGGATGTDIEICSSRGLLILGVVPGSKVDNGKVLIYSTVKRASPSNPIHLKNITVGPLPDMILPNHDCSKIAVANEGEAAVVSNEVVDPQGSVMILTNIDSPSPTVQLVSFASLGTDDALIADGVHLPLPKKAMEYWDEHSDIANDMNFTNVRQNYNSAMNLEPEYLGWSADGSKLYVNLQENSAMVSVSVPLSGSPNAVRIDAYGLQDWSSSGPTEGIDIVKDGKCELVKYPGLYSMRNPDSIQVVTVDGETYILTANEGDDKEIGDYEEKWKANSLLNATNGAAKPKGMTTNSQTAQDYLAQNNASANSKRRLTVGSSAVDYSNAANPVVKKIVMFGGRGISIFKASDSGLALTWDSGSQMEKEGCKNYSWAHNGLQDEEFAGVNGILYNTPGNKMKKTLEEMSDPQEDGCADQGDGNSGPCPLNQTVDERSPKDGPAPEAITSGIACGRLIMVTAGEKNGILFVYDISVISAPSLLFVKHLSPASQTKSPNVAYADSTIGDIDPESMIFVEAEKSPTGNPGVLIAGAWSGTVSWWEFQCPASYFTTTTTLSGTAPIASNTTSTSQGEGSDATSTSQGENSFALSAVPSWGLLVVMSSLV